MRSATPKVLHQIAGRSMIGHVLSAVRRARCDETAVIIGKQGELIEQALAESEPETGVSCYRQEKPLGTANAALAAADAIGTGHEEVLVLFGDTPLLQAETIIRLRKTLQNGADLVVAGFKTDNPHGYGRLIEADGRLLRIREHGDASDEEREIRFCNGGIMAFSGAHALDLLQAVGNENSKSEFYLTDTVEIANERGLKVVAIETPFEEVLGVNTQAELAGAEHLWQQRRRRQLMLEGVSMQAPGTVFLHHDTEIEAGAVIEPNVVFGAGVSVRAGAQIRAFSHLEGATVEQGAIIGPYARLRPGNRHGREFQGGQLC